MGVVEVEAENFEEIEYAGLNSSNEKVILYTNMVCYLG